MPGSSRGPLLVDGSLELARSSTAPNPQKPSWEVGPKNAKVRIIAFYPIDPEHHVVQDLLRSLVKQYAGKVYVKYVDFRPPKGDQEMRRSGNVGVGILVNGQTTVDVKGPAKSYTANFSGEIGRYWIAQHLRDALAQEVTKAYR